MSLRFKNVLFLCGMLFSIGLQAAQGQAEARDEWAESRPYRSVVTYVLRTPTTSRGVFSREHPEVVFVRQVDFGEDGVKVPINFTDEKGRKFYLLKIEANGKMLTRKRPWEPIDGWWNIVPRTFGIVSGIDLRKSCYGLPCAGMFSKKDTSDRSKK
ncbi:hypothetical protein EBR77_02670 [bacterium]|nr:hypothetical protein [bacterium]NBX78493.1 hypothetical protein [bacterium]